jgi:hypothetical protein
MKTTGRLAIVGTAAGALVGAALAVAPGAAAGSYNGCTYPRVCFYLTGTQWSNGTPSTGYQDVTSGYQNLGSLSRGADYVRNTRNDDRAYLRYIRHSTGGTEYLCVLPNQTAIFSSAYTVTGIRIDTAATCP